MTAGQSVLSLSMLLYEASQLAEKLWPTAIAMGCPSGCLAAMVQLQQPLPELPSTYLIGPPLRRLKAGLKATMRGTKQT